MVHSTYQKGRSFFFLFIYFFLFLFFFKKQDKKGLSTQQKAHKTHKYLSTQQQPHLIFLAVEKNNR